MFGNGLLSTCRGEVSNPDIMVAEIDLRKTLVEPNFGRMEFELESKLFIVTETKIRVSEKTKKKNRSVPRLRNRDRHM